MHRHLANLSPSTPDQTNRIQRQTLFWVINMESAMSGFAVCFVCFHRNIYSPIHMYDPPTSTSLFSLMKKAPERSGQK